MKVVLNLVISGIPSILINILVKKKQIGMVLNLVISGIPSILTEAINKAEADGFSFKPCYKWNTFNTPFNPI